jgi:ABC-type sugar transport system ATPase subunit
LRISRGDFQESAPPTCAETLPGRHALCGENGAGKSTLGKILAGIHKPDSGRLFIHGRETFHSLRDAPAAGVGMVHQGRLRENPSVAENLCLGSLPSRGGSSTRRDGSARESAMPAFGTTLDVRRPVGSLSQQQIQIAMARSGAGITIHEPTSSLAGRSGIACTA